MTAALVQARLPVLVMQAHQGAGQGVPLPGRQPGQRRVTEPGQVGAGPACGSGALAAWSYASGRRLQFQSLCAVVAGQRQGVHVPVADLDPGVVGAGVQFGENAQRRVGGFSQSLPGGRDKGRRGIGVGCGAYPPPSRLGGLLSGWSGHTRYSTICYSSSPDNADAT